MVKRGIPRFTIGHARLHKTGKIQHTVTGVRGRIPIPVRSLDNLCIELLPADMRNNYT